MMSFVYDVDLVMDAAVPVPEAVLALPSNCDELKVFVMPAATIDPVPVPENVAVIVTPLRAEEAVAAHSSLSLATDTEPVMPARFVNVSPVAVTDDTVGGDVHELEPLQPTVTNTITVSELPVVVIEQLTDVPLFCVPVQVPSILGVR